MSDFTQAVSHVTLSGVANQGRESVCSNFLRGKCFRAIMVITQSGTCSRTCITLMLYINQYCKLLFMTCIQFYLKTVSIEW